MDEELFELAKDNDLTLDDVAEVQELIDDTGLDPDIVVEIWKEL